MKYEMFGVSRSGHVEFLGYFHREDDALNAVDEYTGLGFKNVQFIKWNIK